MVIHLSDSLFPFGGDILSEDAIAFLLPVLKLLENVI